MPESALIIVCAEAEHAVSQSRAKLDRAALFGIPAHVTVTYPFKPIDELSDGDLSLLRGLFAGMPSFELTGARTGWFGNEVVYVVPADPDPIAGLTAAVARAFPGYLPYGGAFDEVIPHLTIGHSHDHADLLAAEADVLARLPLTQWVDHVELWGGPPIAGPAGVWSSVGSFDLGAPSSPESSPGRI